VVWSELQKAGGGWAKQRLLLSADPTLSAVEAYARHRTVEPLFAAVKLIDGICSWSMRPRCSLGLRAPFPTESCCRLRVSGW
jgi:hypothetical protein